MSARDYAVWGWARNRGVLGDSEALKTFLLTLVDAIKMQPLWVAAVDVEVEIAKLDRDPFEDEGGASATCVLSTSHAAIHGWPMRDPLEDDGGYFTLQVVSCRDFDCNLVMELARGVLGATRVDSRSSLQMPPPALP